MKHHTTIAAISTPPGVGGIAVLRVSGPDARAVCARVFRPAKGSVETMPGYTCLYGRVCDGDAVLDDGILTCFAAPHSYTGEDVLELSVHGGAYLPAHILQVLIQNGAVSAGRGEFTRRALENGKLSLTQAESVMELIAADGAMSARAARAALDGALYRTLKPYIQTLLQVSAHLAAYIDFPEEEVPELAPDMLRANLETVRSGIAKLLDAEKPNHQMLHGIRAAIVGRPNVGKSSLMNLLAGYRRSIVTAAPGTTRDVVEEFVSLDGLVLRLADTAGIRQTDDPIEAEGVKLAESRLADSDLVLAVFDRSEPLDDADRRVLAQCADVSRETPVVIVLNKSDLPDCAETAEIAETFRYRVTVSAKEGSGAEALWAAIREATQTASLDPSAAMLANERQKQAARDASSALTEALTMLDAGWTLDVCSVPVSEALEALLVLSGERADESTIDAVFETFCVGK